MSKDVYSKDVYRVGLIGCGTISDAYIRGLKVFPWLELSALSDIDVARAEEKAQKYGVAKGYSVEEFLADDAVDIAINLTVPTVHAEVSLNALGAGKHVYSEKPLAITREDGKAMLDAADANGLRLGCAPDTFMGGGIQTCRQLLDEGAIGEPLSASAFMLGHGVETWHPSPFFFFQYGGHPLFDMGPYYLTALINLLGPVESVVGMTTTGIPERTVTSEPHAGTVITVDAPVHATALLELASGKPVTMIVSGEVVASELPRIEIYGSEGTLSVPDPNTFDGPVRLKKKGDKTWQDVPLTHSYSGYDRGLGVADMAYALRSGRPHRASGALAYHVLDTLQSIQDASDARRFVEVKSTCERPAPLPPRLKEGELDA